MVARSEHDDMMGALDGRPRPRRNKLQRRPSLEPTGPATEKSSRRAPSFLRILKS